MQGKNECVTVSQVEGIQVLGLSNNKRLSYKGEGWVWV